MNKPKGYADSILQDKYECYLCHDDTSKLDPHEIFFGSNRQVSIKHGFWVWLRRDWHDANSPHETPHNNEIVDNYLRQICQEAYEEKHSRKEFMALIGKNYLED